MTTEPKTRKPRTVAVKPYQITDGAGLHIAFALATTAGRACDLVRPQLVARQLTAAEAAKVAPDDFVTADATNEDTAP